MTRISLPKDYRERVKASIDKHLDWAENVMNGEIEGARFVSPIMFEDCIFHIAIEPLRIGEATAERFKEYAKSHAKS